MSRLWFKCRRMVGEQPHEPKIGPLPAFAASDGEAIALFEHTRHKDPFPDIAPALLNTADLIDYIAATGMLHPFTIDRAKPADMLKPASCGMRLHGEVLYFEGREPKEARKITRTLEPGEELVLEPNSITYVTLEPVLRLPDYIAARFNLTIREIYRGILVGTGPLVDPGFVGHIYLPLHNLTCNEYVLTGGEPVAWMEFTKISPNKSWHDTYNSHGRCAPYVPFPDRKRELTLDKYLARASSKPIMSSIPVSIEKAERSVDRVRRAVQRQVRIVGAFSFLALVAVAIALAGVVITVANLVEDSNSSRTDLTHQVSNLEHEVEALKAQQQTKR